MLLLHFSYAFGAFVAPLIARQFITEFEEDSDNLTNKTGLRQQNKTDLETTGNESRFKFAYWIFASLFLPSIVAYTFYAVKYDFAKCPCQSRNATALNGNESDQRNLVETSRQMSPLQSSTSTGTNTTATSLGHSYFFRIIIIFLLCLFITIYMYLESGYGSWIFTVAVTGDLQLSKHAGSVMQSLFWGTFAFTRLLFALLSLLSIKASVRITGSMMGALITTVVMISFPHNAIAIWIGSAMLGMSFASIYPTMMGWMAETIEITGTAVSIIVTGGLTGVILSTSTGGLISSVSPDSLFYMTFAGVLIATCVVTLLFTFAFLQRRQQQKQQQQQQQQLDEQSSDLNADSDNTEE